MNEDEALKEIPVIVFSGITHQPCQTWFIMSKWLNTLTNPCKPTGRRAVTELLGKEDKVEVEDESKTEPGGTFIDGILTSSSFNIADVELPVDSDTEHEADEVEQQAKTDFRRRNRNLALQGSLENHSIAEVLGKL